MQYGSRRDPVIVTRGVTGKSISWLNRCAHRGNLVCLKRRGHADDLTCVYHVWRYDLEGNLKSVAFRRVAAGLGGMPDSFQLEQHGLKKLRGATFGDLNLRHLVARRAAAAATFSAVMHPRLSCAGILKGRTCPGASSHSGAR